MARHITHWFRSLPEAGNLPVCVEEWERVRNEIEEARLNASFLESEIETLETEIAQTISKDWGKSEIIAAKRQHKRT